MAELKLVVFRESRDLLSDIERIGSAHKVFRKLHHELGDVDWAVVDQNQAVGFDELDGTHNLALLMGVTKPHAREIVVAHQLETPWDHLESEKSRPHLSMCEIKRGIITRELSAYI